MRTLEADLIVVGAGPTGLYAAYYAGFRTLRTVIVDSLPEVGGQITALFPEKPIYDVAGFPAVRGRDLVDALWQQASRWDPTFLMGQSLDAVTDTDDGLIARTSGGTSIHAKAVLICGGIGTFSPRELPCGSSYEDRGLRYFVPRLNDLAGQDVVVVGGGDSALDWALSLEPLARAVHLVHRRPEFRAHERSIEQLKASSVRVWTPYQVEKISGENWVEEVVIATSAGDSQLLSAQAVVAALGFIADLGSIADWGLELRRRRILVDRTMRTSRPRIFAAGDIADYDGKVRLISIGFGEAALAVNHIAPLANSALALTPGHSSDS